MSGEKEIYRGDKHGTVVKVKDGATSIINESNWITLDREDATGAAHAILKHFDVSITEEIEAGLLAENTELRQAHFKKDAHIREVEAGLDRLTRIIDAYRLVIGDMVAHPSKTGAP